MLRKLTLLCNGCGAQKTFEGEDLGDLIKTIDDSKWTDKPDHGRYPQGSMPGLCPSCGSEKKLMDALYERTIKDLGFESSKRM